MITTLLDLMKTKQPVRCAKPTVGILALAAMLSCASAEDWPQYLGPTRNSISPQKGILRSWPAKGPEVLWTASVGRGFGGPVIKDGKVYLLDRDDKVGDKLRCLDLANGKELWSFAYDAPGTVMFPGSRSVPAVDGDKVYSCGHNGDLYCIDTKTHKPIWNKNVWKDFGGDKLPFWAITQCPLVYGDLLIVASQAPQAGLVAYEKLTGNIKWKTPPLGLISYASPAIVKVDGKDHVVMITGSTNPFQRTGPVDELGNVVGIEPLTGEILWKFDKWHCHIPVASAVDAGENRMLIAGGYELGALMIKVEKKADGSYGTTELFRTKQFGDQTKPPVLHKGHFYAEYGTNERRDGMVCMNLDGKILWQTKRSPDFNKGSMILAEGLILASDGARSLYLVEPDPSGFKQLASAELFPEASAGSENDMASRVGGRNQNWAPMALADGKLLIRDQTQLKCVKVAN
jgi:outer membrane protein assembly factor BamB